MAEAARDLESSDPFVNREPVRTDVHCTECAKNFIGRLDFRLDGMHRIVCPYCGHIHFRVIKDGRITGERWPSDLRPEDEQVPVIPVSVWRHDSLAAQTDTASHFIRQSWLNRGDWE